MDKTCVLWKKYRCLIQRGAPQAAINTARMIWVCSDPTKAFNILNNYVKSFNTNNELVLVGSKETIENDLLQCQENDDNDKVYLDTVFNELNSLPNFMYSACVNTLNKAVPARSEKGVKLLNNLLLGRHRVVYTNSVANESIFQKLKICNYGDLATFIGTNITVMAWAEGIDDDTWKGTATENQTGMSGQYIVCGDQYGDGNSGCLTNDTSGVSGIVYKSCNCNADDADVNCSGNTDYGGDDPDACVQSQDFQLISCDEGSFSCNHDIRTQKSYPNKAEYPTCNNDGGYGIQDVSGQSNGWPYECQFCAAGYYQTQGGQSYCEACPAGTSSIVVASSEEGNCQPCDADTYADASGTAGPGCTPCPSGKWTNNQTGSTTCVEKPTCEIRDNSWHIVLNDELCGPYSYSSQDDCDVAILDCVDSDNNPKVPMFSKINGENVILPGAYVSILLMAYNDNYGNTPQWPQADISFEKRYWDQITSTYRTDTVPAPGEIKNPRPFASLSGLGTPHPLFYDSSGIIKFSGNFTDSKTSGTADNSWNYIDISGGTMLGLLFGQESTLKGGEWTAHLDYTTQDDFNEAAFDKVYPSKNWYWDDLEGTLQPEDYADNWYNKDAWSYCSAGTGCHGWYKNPWYYDPDNTTTAKVTNIHGIWASAAVAYHPTEGYLAVDIACLGSNI